MILPGIRRRDMDQVVHLHLHTQFGDLLGNPYINIFKGEVCLESNVWKFVCLNRLVRLVRLGDQVNYHISIGNHLSHRVDVSRTVKDEASMAQVEHRLDFTMFCLVSTVANVSIGAIFACYAIKKSGEKQWEKIVLLMQPL